MEGLGQGLHCRHLRIRGEGGRKNPFVDLK